MAHRFRPFRWQKGQLRLMLEALTAPAADRPRWLTILLWLGIPTMLLIPIGVSFWAVTDLSRLPALPECFAVSWSDDNSSARLYCAKISADRNTPQDLQQALALVSHIPRTDPLRLDTDRRIRQWSNDLLQLGEAKYQEGDLDGAIEIAEKIPQAACKLAGAQMTGFSSGKTPGTKRRFCLTMPSRSSEIRIGTG